MSWWVIFIFFVAPYPYPIPSIVPNIYLSFMIFLSVSQTPVYLQWVNTHLAQCLNSVLNMKSLVGAFNQEKALVGAISTNVKTDESFAALVIN